VISAWSLLLVIGLELKCSGIILDVIHIGYRCQILIELEFLAKLGHYACKSEKLIHNINSGLMVNDLVRATILGMSFVISLRFSDFIPAFHSV
jgi:hypothetical protein